jgi:Fur family transcriptional regulator, ferric uptake regulator
MQVIRIMNILSEKPTIIESGLKGTKSRLAVMHILEEEKRPLDVSEILYGLKEHNVTTDQATVYRILDIFSQKGLVHRFEFGEGKFRYEKAGEDHHHLICENCGRIEDISDCNISILEKEIQKKKGFTVTRHSLEFFGTCNRCQR